MEKDECEPFYFQTRGSSVIRRERHGEIAKGKKCERERERELL